MSASLLLLLGGPAFQEAVPTPGDPPATPAPTIDEPAPATSSAELRRVHIVIDRFREVGGVVLSEDDASITIRREGRTETFERNKVLAIVPLLEIAHDGETGIVYMRDGSILEAKVLEDAYDHVTVEVEGINHKIPRDEVDHIQILPAFEAWLAHIRTQIKPDDLEARIELAKWMAENGRLQQARTELLEVIAIDDHPEAKQLLQLLDARIELEGEGTSAPKPLPPKIDRTAGLPKRQITEDDVNIIRVYEIDFNRPPKVQVTKKTMEKLIADHGEHPLIPADTRARDRLFALHDIDQVKLIFDVKARELYPQIKVESTPHSLDLFRKRVHNAWLIRNCATSGCHGGPNAGRFFLHRTDTSDPRTMLENLLILERLELGGPHRLIDYENPEMSLLIQHALPAGEARVPHPSVPGYSPVFPPGESRMRTETLRWIEAMYQPRPKYPVEFMPATLDAPLQADPPRIPR